MRHLTLDDNTARQLIDSLSIYGEYLRVDALAVKVQ